LALKDRAELDVAIVSARKAIELQPNLAGAHYNLGMALRKAGQEEEAQKELDEAQRLGCKPAQE
jgi:Flp pilus assembly protein TadD